MTKTPKYAVYGEMGEIEGYEEELYNERFASLLFLIQILTFIL